MCLSVNRPNVPTPVAIPGKTKSIDSTVVKEKQLNLDLPQDFGKEFQNFNLKDNTAEVTSYPNPKKMNYPNLPIYNDPDSHIRLKESSPNSAKIEIGNPNEKAFLTLKVRNEETYGSFNGQSNIHTKSKMSIDSPYLKEIARDYAKETVMDNLVTPLRGAIGKTAADTTLGVAAVATALVSAKHLPDGHVKVDLPTKKITGDDSLKARVILGYGDGNNLKPTGFEVKKRYEHNEQNFDLKAAFRKDAEVNGIKGVDKVELEAIITDVNQKWDSGAISMRVGHDKVTGTSAGIFYRKQF